jgi:hypothetical protein
MEKNRALGTRFGGLRFSSNQRVDRVTTMGDDALSASLSDNVCPFSFLIFRAPGSGFSIPGAH